MSKRSTTISPSQLDALSCRFAWHLGYRCGYRPIRSSPALEFGTGIHTALEFYYGKKGDPISFFQHWADERKKILKPEHDDDIKRMDDAKKLGSVMLQGYLDRYDGKDGFDVLATEQYLKRRLPIPGKETFSKCSVAIRLDGLVRDHQTRKLFSLEHKTFSRFQLSFLDLGHQYTAQVWVGQELAKQLGLDESIAGVIYNGLRKQAPGPKVKLELFERHRIYKTEQQIKVFLHRAYHQYREAICGHVAVYPQPDPIRCGQCDFKEVCAEYHRGGDWKFLLSELFTKRED